jgi:hypothetical protein
VETWEKARKDAPSGHDRWPGREYFLQMRLPRGAVHNELRDLRSRGGGGNGPPVKTRVTLAVVRGPFLPPPPHAPSCSIRTGFPLRGPRTCNFNLGRFCTPPRRSEKQGATGECKGFWASSRNQKKYFGFEIFSRLVARDSFQGRRKRLSRDPV